MIDIETAWGKFTLKDTFSGTIVRNRDGTQFHLELCPFTSKNNMLWNNSYIGKRKWKM